MPSTWYIARDGTQHGPLSEREFTEFVKRGHLLEHDLVWHEGLTEWVVSSAFQSPRTPTSLADRDQAVSETAYSQPVETTGLSTVTLFLRKQVVGWFAVVATAVTLLGGIEPLIQLSGWARYIWNRWRGASESLWDAILMPLGIELPSLGKACLTFVALQIVLALSVPRLPDGSNDQSPRLKTEWAAAILFALFILPTIYRANGRAIIALATVLSLPTLVLIDRAGEAEVAKRLWTVVGAFVTLFILNLLSTALPQLRDMLVPPV